MGLPGWLTGKSLPTNAGDIRDMGWSLGQEDPLAEGIATRSSIQMVNEGDLGWEGLSLGWEDRLEEGLATHFGSLAWRFPLDRGVCWDTVHGVAKGRTRLSN